MIWNHARVAAVYLLCLVVVLAPVACLGPTLTEDQYSMFLGEVAAMEREGTLTAAEAETLREWAESLKSNGGGVDWDRVTEIGVGMIGAVLAALTGVRLTRGPAKPVDRSQGKLLPEVLSDYLAKRQREEIAISEAAAARKVGESPAAGA